MNALQSSRQTPAETSPSTGWMINHLRPHLCRDIIRVVEEAVDRCLPDFAAATGVPLRLVMPADAPGVESRSGCRLCAPHTPDECVCQSIHHNLRQQAVTQRAAACSICPAGFTCGAVPVFAWAQALAVIEVGPVVLRPDGSAVSQTRSGKRTVSSRPSDASGTGDALTVIGEKRFAADLKVLEILADHIGHQVSQRNIADAEASDPVAVVRKFVAEHLMEHLTLGTLAKQAHLSGDRVSRLFHKTMGMSLPEYIARLRIDQACTMLLEGPQRVSEIAFACGFDSLPHFNRWFHRLIGVAPTEFRRQHGHNGRKGRVP
jgi:AraC-like DNA-binding protein